MKQIIEKTGLYILLAALAVLLVVAGTVGFNLGKRQADAGLIPVSALGSLQDSLKTVRAALRSSDGMIATLRGYGASRESQIKVQAATIADMRVKLAKLEGGGPGKPVDEVWSTFNDRALTAFYRQKPDSLTYVMNPRPMQISLVEGLNNNWTAYAWDVWANQPAVIDTMDIQRNREWQPPKPWYQKIGTILKYTGVAAVAGGAGYLIGRK